VPELTELLSAVHVGVKPQEPWVPLWRDLPLPPDVFGASAVPLSCLGTPPPRTRLEWCLSRQVLNFAQNLQSCFSCVSASGYCCTDVSCCDFCVERLFVQNTAYPVTRTSPNLDMILAFHFAPRVPNVFIYREEAEYIVGTRNNDMISTEHSTLLLFSAVLVHECTLPLWIPPL
jgi:hypothetical protein